MQLRALQADPALHYARRARPPAAASTTSARRARWTELATLRAAQPQARLLAGTTDIGLWVNKNFRDLGDLIYLGDVAELQRIDVVDGALHIGAGALARGRLGRDWRRAGRRCAKWGCASPPAGAPCRHDGRQRRQRLADRRQRAGADGAGRTRRAAPGRAPARDAARRLLPRLHEEPARAGRVPAGDRSCRCPLPRRQVRGYKISKRYDCDISAVCAGLAITLDGDRVRRRALRLRRHGGDRQARRRRRGRRAAASPGPRPRCSAAMAALGARLHAADRLARQCRLPAQAARRPAAAAAGWKRGPHAPLAAHETRVDVLGA